MKDSIKIGLLWGIVLFAATILLVQFLSYHQAKEKASHGMSQMSYDGWLI
jgi:hypothetical protein